jgi:signal peptidase I
LLPVIPLISFVLVFGLVRPVVASPFYVGSESMVPTLKVWYRVLINKLAPTTSRNPCVGTLMRGF